MRFVWSSALKDLRRQLRDPVALLFWAGVPALIAVLIVLAFGGREARAPRVELLVADEDSSFVSRLLIGSFGQTQLFDVIPTNRATGRRRLDRGRGSALLVIPRGFGQALLEEAPTTLELIKNPAQEILPEIAQQYVEILTDASFYAQRLFGEQIRTIRAESARGGGPSDSLVAAVSVGVRRRLENAGRYLAPPVLSLRVVDETKRRAASDTASGTGAAGGKRAPATDGIGFLFYPGILFMAILFSAQGVSADLWLEKTRGTLRKAMTTPGGVAACLAGKIVAGAIIVAGVGGGGAGGRAVRPPARAAGRGAPLRGAGRERLRHAAARPDRGLEPAHHQPRDLAAHHAAADARRQLLPVAEDAVRPSWRASAG